MATYLFPALLVLLCSLIAAFNLFFPQIISVLIMGLSVFAAWAIVKVNEG
jgi:hypothetical protein